MREKIIDLMSQKNYTPMTLEDLSAVFEVPQDGLLKLLNQLEADYLIRKTKKKKYDLLKRFNLFVGVIEMKEKGFGFIRSDEFIEEFFVPKFLTGGAMDQDRVLFSVTDTAMVSGSKKEAAVVEIIERHLKRVIGTITMSNQNQKEFHPQDDKIDLTFETLDFGIAVIGDVVIFEIEQYANINTVRGRIIDILGNQNDIGIDIKSIAYKYGFSETFDPQAIEEIKQMQIDMNEERTRRRFVSETVITIDGADAKDLDDAVSIERLANGNYRLGVYIADVSYYVTEGSKLNEQALERGTSVYLADRVIPMLPHKLSNDWCSLNPNEEKLVMGCVMEIDDLGHVVNHDIFEGIMVSNYRMTYDDVNAILEKEDSTLINKYHDIIDKLKQMEMLAEVLRMMRYRRGSLDFDIPESKIVVDQNGKPIDIVLRTRGVGEKLIEEFMLIANETVAQTVAHLNLPFIYRIHDEPNDLKLQKFQTIAKAAGYTFPVRKNKVAVHVLQELLAKLKETDAGLSMLLLRMMAKAKYSEKNIGHYGLASACYTHFTSPIRRYPDLLVHRLLRQYLIRGEVGTREQDEALDKIIYAAYQSSKKERDAIECEYEVEDMKKAEFMENHIGERYPATINAVTNFGLFVSLDNTIEGLIHISELDGYFVYDEAKMMLVSRNKEYRLGDKLNIIVKNASKEKRQIDFAIVRGENNGKQNKKYRQKQTRKS